MTGQPLKAHNTDALMAHVVCDECGHPMVYDIDQEIEDREKGTPREIGEPVICTNKRCGTKGRKLRRRM